MSLCLQAWTVGSVGWLKGWRNPNWEVVKLQGSVEFCCMQESYDIVGQLLFGDFLGLASHLRAEASSVRGFPAAQRERPRHV